MSDTPAQRALAPDLGAAARLVSLADPDTVATALDALSKPSELAAAKTAAWELGRKRYNWNVEKDVLLRSVEAAFEKQGGAGR